VTTSVTLGNDETAIGGHAAIAPIARNLTGQGSVKPEAPLRQRIERSAGAPIERQKATCLARRRGSAASKAPLSSFRIKRS
jgi:hypothetical protein